MYTPTHTHTYIHTITPTHIKTQYVTNTIHIKKYEYKILTNIISWKF